jgi:hypothetical protein
MGSWLLGPDPASGPPIPTMGLTLWLKAGAGITLDGMSHVSTWADQSGNGNDFVSSGTGAGPVVGASINSLTTVDFTAASSQVLELTLPRALSDLLTASAYTMFSVWQYTGSVPFSVYSNSPAVIEDNSGYWGMLSGVTAGVVTASGYNYPYYDNATFAVGAPHRIKSQLSSGTLYVTVDGGSPTTLLAGNVGSLLAAVELGGSGYNNFFNGPIGEVIIYNRVTSSGEDTAIDAYLKAAWGM